MWYTLPSVPSPPFFLGALCVFAREQDLIAAGSGEATPGLLTCPGLALPGPGLRLSFDGGIRGASPWPWFLCAARKMIFVCGTFVVQTTYYVL